MPDWLTGHGTGCRIVALYFAKDPANFRLQAIIIVFVLLIITQPLVYESQCNDLCTPMLDYKCCCTER